MSSCTTMPIIAEEENHCIFKNPNVKNINTNVEAEYVESYIHYYQSLPKTIEIDKRESQSIKETNAEYEARCMAFEYITG